jgi:hypothetical protein
MLYQRKDDTTAYYTPALHMRDLNKIRYATTHFKYRTGMYIRTTMHILLFLLFNDTN